GCGCHCCKNFSRAYLRHLFKAKEMLAMRLAVLHNLYFYNKLTAEIRQALDEGRFAEYKRAKLEGFRENGSK
ncbi:MAG: tRNA-guanine transglycosylase, partial [Eubacterium sp.]|nr:tRNA-guanine transglycosylase [Eubacterium sp.]